MRIAGNKVKHISDFYYSELGTLYQRPEIEAMLGLSVSRYLGLSRAELATHFEDNINQSDLLKLYDCCKELKEQIPIQYILGEAWFYNLRFTVNKNVLIPRPETEELVDMVIKENKDASFIFDIGTGSGCIPIAIKKNLPNCSLFACDISAEALKLAEKNSNANGTPVRFFETSVLDSNFYKIVDAKFDVIVSNPPYILKGEEHTLEKHVLDHEPRLALFVEGGDGIIFYRKIIDASRTYLKNNGRLYFELNPATAEEVKNCAISSGIFSNVELLKDMSGNIRFLKAVKN